VRLHKAAILAEPPVRRPLRKGTADEGLDAREGCKEGPEMRALVTGGAGFVGSHVVDRLLAEGAEVRVLDDFSTGRRQNLKHAASAVEVLEGDVRDADLVRRAAHGCEVILHQAALPSVPRSIADPMASHQVNVTGTLNVLIAARDENVRRVIYASSSSVYGFNPELPKSESATPLPMSPYAAAKLAGESYCASFGNVYGLETVALRYFNIFGPRQDPGSEYAAVIPRWATALSAGRPPTIFGDGEQSRDFTYIENVVDANMAAVVAPDAPGHVFNIACGRRTTLNALARELIARIGTNVEPTYWPERAGDVRHSLADVSKAAQILGYTPKVDLREGLALTVAGYIDSGVLQAA
jgi:UDP-glucose 4-epimerase